MAIYPACSGFEEGPGANFAPATMGSFVKQNSPNERRLREARAESTVIHEARNFHERQARKYGVDTNRGIAHFRASKIFAREGKLQEMLDQMNQQKGDGGTELGELPPKAIMKAHKAAAKFHKGQAEKAGLDSDLGHAHVAAMEKHLDTFKKAKSAHQASKAPQPKQQMGQKQQMQPKPMTQPSPGGAMPNVGESEEGGPGSGPRKGRIGKPKGGLSGTSRGTHFPPDKKKKGGLGITEFRGNIKDIFDDSKWDKKGNPKKEAAGGISSKNSPVPVPKKSEQPNEDIKQNKPPVSVQPADANKPGMDGGTRLRQTPGAHAGMIKASARREAIERFGEAHDHRGPGFGMDCTEPSPVKKQMKPDTVYRAKRQKMIGGTAAATDDNEYFTNHHESRRRL